jgi:hypothetical protein
VVPVDARYRLGEVLLVQRSSIWSLRAEAAATDDGQREGFRRVRHETYSEGQPNALLPEEVPVFLGALRELFAQHYATVFLGMVTGLKPSSLRPLRREGPEADVLWEEPKLLVRRSHTLGDEVMNAAAREVPDPLAGGGRRGPCAGTWRRSWRRRR